MKDEKKDLIFLDAKLTDRLSLRAFRAELSNGHGFVAYAQDDAPAVPEIGGTVRVCFSPFDMSAGRIFFEDVK